MTAKKKPRWHVRATRSVKAHPWVTWGTLASIATVLPVLFAGGAWFFGHFQTVEAAELDRQKTSRQFQEVLHQLARQESITLRNKVNDCRSRVVRSMEKASCLQYEQEYREAAKREQYLYQQLQEAHK